MTDSEAPELCDTDSTGEAEIDCTWIHDFKKPSRNLPKPIYLIRKRNIETESVRDRNYSEA